MNSKKIIYIAAAILIIVIIIAVFIALSFSGQSNPNINTPPIPTPLPGTNVTRGLIKLISTTPMNQAVDVPTNTKPVLTFNARIDTSNPRVFMSPETPITFTFSGSTILINPQEALKPSTQYTVTATLGDQTFYMTFTTVGVTPTIAPDTRPVDLINEEQTILKNTRPDVYLSNYTPYANGGTSITSGYVSTPTGHFQFMVRGTQTDFTQWAKSKQLTDAQIASLDVVYK